MQLKVTEMAVDWFKDELDAMPGDYIRFFARYGGCSTVQSGFSLGIAKEKPAEMGKRIEAGGITFYIEQGDLWYFQDADLTVDYNPHQDELTFSYEKGE